ncbi:hypothetical protein ACJX0J_035231 [Zea mays]
MDGHTESFMRIYNFKIEVDEEHKQQGQLRPWLHFQVHGGGHTIIACFKKNHYNLPLQVQIFRAHTKMTSTVAYLHHVKNGHIKKTLGKRIIEVRWFSTSIYHDCVFCNTLFILNDIIYYF